MASTIDSIRTIITAKHSFLKILILSGLMAYPAYQIAFVKFEGWATLWPILTIFLLLYNIGFIVNTIHNEINDRSILIPGIFNPLQFVAVGIGTIISIAPILALMIYAYFALFQLGTTKGLPDAFTISVVSLVEVILYVMMVAQIMQFAHKLNPLFAYNIVSIFKNFTDILFKSILLIIVYALVAALTVVPIGVIMIQMFGTQSFGFLYYILMVFFLFLLFTLYFYGQIYMENLVANLEINYDEGVEDIVDKDKRI